ncbi:Aste57867_21785 [Aphanomyces stellatus]|uniref:Aste57867_21785 protein n=1 Tax=Aphanomyces stellatus TaxID=120398 RepID=A0A485LJP1_9STRA|nr:hypothetical protein As57867_021716 [Aphanomyces stellatus]VFT98454.1 Aste57867_21785 [Aphanomyces stellatus]
MAMLPEKEDMDALMDEFDNEGPSAPRSTRVATQHAPSTYPTALPRYPSLSNVSPTTSTMPPSSAPPSIRKYPSLHDTRPVYQPPLPPKFTPAPPLVASRIDDPRHPTPPIVISATPSGPPVVSPYSAPTVDPSATPPLSVEALPTLCEEEPIHTAPSPPALNDAMGTADARASIIEDDDPSRDIEGELQSFQAVMHHIDLALRGETPHQIEQRAAREKARQERETLRLERQLAQHEQHVQRLEARLAKQRVDFESSG